MEISIPEGVKLKDTTIVMCEKGVIFNNYPDVEKVINIVNIKK